MVVAVAICELHLPGSRNLKEKRRVLQRLIGRLHSRHRISVAETDFLDLHQRGQIAVAWVERERHGMERRMEQIRRLLESDADALMIRWEPDYWEEMP